MKQFFLVQKLLLLILACNVMKAQNQLYTVLVGDTVVLSVTGHTGSIQWQQSTDSIIWSNITGAITTPYKYKTVSSTSNKRHFRAKVEDNCPNYPWYSSVISTKVLANTNSVQLGDFFHGGIVFYANGSGSGLISPSGFQYICTWGCAGTSITGSTSLTNGASNTSAIVVGCSDRPIAASVCDTLTLNGFDDWYLPAKDQLNTLYQQRNLVGGFNTSFMFKYWSSTEYNANSSWCQSFSDGSQVNNDKTSFFGLACCIRSFSSTDILKKTYCSVTVTDQPQTVDITDHPLSQNKCFGYSVTFSVTATGTPPYTYQWKRDGSIIPGATGSSYYKGGLSLSEEGNYTCEVTNQCRTTESNIAELKVIQLTADAGTADIICPGQGAQLQATATSNYTVLSGTYSFQWWPATGLSATNINNPVASPAYTTNYSVSIHDELGCNSSDIVSVLVQNPYQDEQICLVTVDTSTWKNKILWNKTENVGTEYYLIYKETGTNIYSQIGNINSTQAPEFVDLFSQPEVHGDKYKITVIDTCGNESALDSCYYHKTINLTIAAFGSTMGLNWDDYVDESGNFVPIRYYIFRGTSPSDMALYDSVSGSFNSYNDLNVFNIFYYMIGVKKPSGCGAKSDLWSFSNNKDNSIFVGMVEDNCFGLATLSLFPNPTKDVLNISINKKATLEIINVQGQIVDIKSLTEKVNNLDLSNLVSGVYTLRVKTNRGIAIKKLIKQ